MASDDIPNSLSTGVTRPGSLLLSTFNNLSDDDKRDLSLKVQDKKLELDAKAEEADLRHRASSADMVNTISQVNALERSTNSDYRIRAEYETASGRTNIEIKRSNYTVIIVIAIVIALLVLILFSK